MHITHKAGLALALLFGIGISALPAYAGNPGVTQLASSTFDTDSEGWQIANLIYGSNQGASPTVLGYFTPTYNNTGGDPGGYVSILDPTSNQAFYWLAPSKFLGNKSSAYGGTLNYDLADTDLSDTFHQEDIILVSSSKTLVYDLGTIPADTFTHFSVGLSQAGWRENSLSGPSATQADMQGVLSSLSAIYIRGEYSLAVDTGSLDNVTINSAPVPEASSVVSLGLLLCLGLGGLAVTTRRRKAWAAK